MEDFLEINYEKNMKMLSDAIKYCEENFLHDDLINSLYTDDDLKKQLCLIELNEIFSQEEANIIVLHLTNHSGPVREAASYCILKLIKQKEFNQFFQADDILDTFVKAITDINPSVSRNAVEIIKYIDNAQFIYNEIISQINITLNKLEEIKPNRSYVANKQNFGIYWNLEALISISDKIQAENELFEILKKTAISNDYTIREKTAKVIAKFYKKNNNFTEIISILKDDTNIYVKKYINVL